MCQIEMHSVICWLNRQPWWCTCVRLWTEHPMNHEIKFYLDKKLNSYQLSLCYGRTIWFMYVFISILFTSVTLIFMTGPLITGYTWFISSISCQTVADYLLFTSWTGLWTVLRNWSFHRFIINVILWSEVITLMPNLANQQRQDSNREVQTHKSGVQKKIPLTQPTLTG